MTKWRFRCATIIGCLVLFSGLEVRATDQYSRSDEVTHSDHLYQKARRQRRAGLILTAVVAPTVLLAGAIPATALSVVGHLEAEQAKKECDEEDSSQMCGFLAGFEDSFAGFIIGISTAVIVTGILIPGLVLTIRGTRRMRRLAPYPSPTVSVLPSFGGLQLHLTF